MEWKKCFLGADALRIKRVLLYTNMILESELQRYDMTHEKRNNNKDIIC